MERKTGVVICLILGLILGLSVLLQYNSVDVELISSLTTIQQANDRAVSDNQYPEPSPDAESRCTFQERRDFLRSQCQNLFGLNPDTTTSTSIGYTLLDHERQTLGCLISKTGSDSWFRFMVNSKDRVHPGYSNDEYPYILHLSIRNNTYLKRLGLEYLHSLEFSDINEKYQNYTKYMIVRHPMQRTVSGYYELGHLYTTDFDKFTSRLASGELIDIDAPWKTYGAYCKPCLVDYDVIMRSESIDEDIKIFNQIAGIDRDKSVPFDHLNPFLHNKSESVTKSAHNYKYDAIYKELMQKKAKTIERIAKIYDADMEVLGYHWNFLTGESTCGIKQNNRYCC